MATVKSTRPRSRRKAKFPLFRHASGQFAKKIVGRLYYFGTDRDEALARYKVESDNIKAGRDRYGDPVTGAKYPLGDLLNEFLEAKFRRVESDEMSKRHFDDLQRAAKLIASMIGRHREVESLRPDDFAPVRTKLASRHSVISLVREIRNVRQPFNWAWKNGKLDRPVRFGTALDPPPKKKLRLAKREAGDLTMDPGGIRKMLDASDPVMKVMILLGINCALGPSDLAVMEFRHVNGEWLNFPRPKTGIDRRCWLWPETRDALAAYLTVRKKPKRPEFANRVFVTKYGNPWSNPTTKGAPVSAEFHKVAEKLGLYRVGWSFYSLHRTFRTIADASLDTVTCDAIMGHNDDSMGGLYRQRIADERFVKVAEHVRQWLFEKSE